MTPTQRTLAELRARGYRAEVVERWIPGANIRRDLFGIIDVFATNKHATLGVQVCGQAWSSHVTKLLVDNAATCFEWLECASRRLELWGWAKRKPRGQRVYYQLRRGIITNREGQLHLEEIAS